MTPPYKMLELFSGSGIMAQTFRDHGWLIQTIDNNPRYSPHFIEDINGLDPETIIDRFGHPDVVWSSPPCECFSVASIGSNWIGDYKPKTAKTRKMIGLHKHALELIKELRPTYWFIENPRGVLRKMPFMRGLPRYTITYCQYGDERMKPTDIWTNHPNPRFKPMCKNGDSCHDAAPRGSRTGTQGRKNDHERSKLPEELCEHIVKICEVPK
jgi:site-specific DNA-cytosine methylase